MRVNDVRLGRRDLSASTAPSQRFGEFMRAVLDIVIYALDLYKLVIVAGAVLVPG